MARRKYPYEKWFAEARFVLRRGEDYHSSQSTMAQVLRNNAWRRGLRVRIEDTGDGLVVEVTGRTARAVPHTDQAGVTR